MISWIVGAILAGSLPPPVLLQTQGRAELYVFAPVKEGQIHIEFSDVLPLVMVVKSVVPTPPTWPRRWFTSPAWRVVEADRAYRLPDQPHHPAIRLVLEPLAPGNQTIDLASLNLGVDQNITWEPLSVQIASRIAEPDLKKMRDITAIESMPSPPPSEPLWPWIAGPILIMVPMGLWWWMRKKLASPRAVQRWALYELEKLRKLRLLERDRREEFCTLLSNIVRRFLEKRFGWPARRMTTQELEHHLTSLALDPGQASSLLAWMRHCDQAKFSRQWTEREKCDRLWHEAKSLVQDWFK